MSALFMRGEINNRVLSLTALGGAAVALSALVAWAPSHTGPDAAEASLDLNPAFENPSLAAADPVLHQSSAQSGPSSQAPLPDTGAYPQASFLSSSASADEQSVWSQGSPEPASGMDQSFTSEPVYVEPTSAGEAGASGTPGSNLDDDEIE
jgi:hypothetical protein